MALHDGIAEVVQTTSSSQSLILSQVFDADVGEALGDVPDEVSEDGFVVVANNEDFLDFLDFGDRPEAVLDYGVAGDFEERLWVVRRGVFIGVWHTLGKSRDRGLNRVPRDGPPTWPLSALQVQVGQWDARLFIPVSLLLSTLARLFGRAVAG